MTLAASIYVLATLGITAFQFALALGAPWGHLAMGGRHPGIFPPAMRVSALFQGIILILLALVVMRYAGLLDGGPVLARPGLVWLPVGFAAIASVLNTITPSKAERRLWLPVALVMLAASLFVAISPVPSE